MVVFICDALQRVPDPLADVSGVRVIRRTITTNDVIDDAIAMRIRIRSSRLAIETREFEL